MSNPIYKEFFPSDFTNKILKRNGVRGEAACEIMAAAINAVNPYKCIQESFQFSRGIVKIDHQEFSIDDYERIFLIGFGKASVSMAQALVDVLGSRISTAQVITKDKKYLEENQTNSPLQVFLGGHPLPDKTSVDSTQTILNNLPEMTENDLVFVVISGGGSALFTAPSEGINLTELQELTAELLRCGADIHEINTLRKHLDQVKGGGLVLRLQPAVVHTFILSDVVGDRLDMIASGPTVPDPTTYRDALGILKKYDLMNKIPKSILETLEDGLNSKIPETLKPEDFPFKRVHNHLVGSNIQAAVAAKLKGEKLGYHTLIVSSHLTGRTPAVAECFEGIIKTVKFHEQPVGKPVCLIFGGETTVEVMGNGLGGRNQDLALQMVHRLVDKPGVLFVSLATDGEDGPTDAAGAASDACVFRDGSAMLELGIDTYIDTNNSYAYFKEMGGLIKTGSTGTNVNDLAIILIDEQD